MVINVMGVDSSKKEASSVTKSRNKIARIFSRYFIHAQACVSTSTLYTPDCTRGISELLREIKNNVQTCPVDKEKERYTFPHLFGIILGREILRCRESVFHQSIYVCYTCVFLFVLIYFE